MKRSTTTLGLDGLRTGSPQVLGAVRLVPLLRDEAPGDLRISLRNYGQSLGLVGLDSRPEEAGTKYLAYVPHGFVISHTSDGTSAALGTTLGPSKPSFVTLHHRMVKGETGDGPDRFRLLPLHLALEGFLGLHFSGPTTLWTEYSDWARRHGLDPRIERSTRGLWIRCLAEAIATFEIHPRQVGLLVFVAEALASAFVVSHPDDYRKLHTSVLEDFFGALIYGYAMLYPDSPTAETTLDLARVESIDDLGREVARVRRDWDEYAVLLSSSLFGKVVNVELVRELAPFRLERFMPKFDPNEECHIGERIVRADGTLEYLKTFRLSQTQIRRAYLLEGLAAASWNLIDAAARFQCTREDLLRRIVNAGFGYILRPHIVRGL